MQLIIDTYKKTGELHHGYCIIGNRDSVYERLCQFLEQELGFAVRGNADFWVGEYDSFGIDESRAVKEVHANKSFRGDARKIYVIKAHTMTREAQNALLKVFEEPGPGNHFFILTAHGDMLLPTLRSRLLMVMDESSQGDSGDGVVRANAEKFIASSIPKRLVFVKNLLDDIADEKKSKNDAVLFIDSVIHTLKHRKKPIEWTRQDVSLLEELLVMSGYIGDRAASVKMVLEHISLIVV